MRRQRHYQQRHRPNQVNGHHPIGDEAESLVKAMIAAVTRPQRRNHQNAHYDQQQPTRPCGKWVGKRPVEASDGEQSEHRWPPCFVLNDVGFCVFLFCHKLHHRGREPSFSA